MNEEEELRRTVFRVAEKCCKECLFSPNKIVDDGRKGQIITDCLKNGAFFRCHKGDLQGKIICCRAFYEKHGRDILLIRLAEWLDGVSFVPVE